VIRRRDHLLAIGLSLFAYGFGALYLAGGDTTRGLAFIAFPTAGLVLYILGVTRRRQGAARAARPRADRRSLRGQRMGFGTIKNADITLSFQYGNDGRVWRVVAYGPDGAEISSAGDSVRGLSVEEAMAAISFDVEALMRGQDA
jgi:hypothetical protein